MKAHRPVDPAYQVLYSELIDRCLDDTFVSDFPPTGRFVPVEVSGRKYWYFDRPKTSGQGQARQYVGPFDDPEISKRVAVFKTLKANLKARRRLVTTLTGSARLSRPLRIAGQIVDGLGKAGFFRLRGVLVGTVAYQCYSAVLGRRLNAESMQTLDADFAQFREISAAVGDSLPSILDVLRGIDPSFREIPHQLDGRASTQFISGDNFRIDFLTPNRGSDDEAGRPVRMPALGGASAAPLRFLDYLIRQPIRAVLLHGSGVPVVIPSPERYAIHKMIVGSRRRDDGDAASKASKDRLQARSIIEAMIETRQQTELASVFMEAWDRGKHWSAASRQSIATYDLEFQNLLRHEISKGVVELGEPPSSYFGADAENRATR